VLDDAVAGAKERRDRSGRELSEAVRTDSGPRLPAASRTVAHTMFQAARRGDQPSCTG
jgi:hypothetical protein